MKENKKYKFLQMQGSLWPAFIVVRLGNQIDNDFFHTILSHKLWIML